MICPFEIGDTVWHGARYWKQDGLRPNEVIGWNVEYVPWKVIHLTPRRIVIGRGGYRLHLNRQVMERDGRQYHSRVHEYFFAEKPDHVGDYPAMIDRTVMVVTETEQ